MNKAQGGEKKEAQEYATELLATYIPTTGAAPQKDAIKTLGSGRSEVNSQSSHFLDGLHQHMGLLPA